MNGVQCYEPFGGNSTKKSHFFMWVGAITLQYALMDIEITSDYMKLLRSKKMENNLYMVI